MDPGDGGTQASLAQRLASEGDAPNTAVHAAFIARILAERNQLNQASTSAQGQASEEDSDVPTGDNEASIARILSESQDFVQATTSAQRQAGESCSDVHIIAHTESSIAKILSESKEIFSQHASLDVLTGRLPMVTDNSGPELGVPRVPPFIKKELKSIKGTDYNCNDEVAKEKKSVSKGSAGLADLRNSIDESRDQRRQRGRVRSRSRPPEQI